jgi:hypothetical protein
MKVHYPAKNLLDTNMKNIMAAEDTTFFICILNRKFKKYITNFPFIEFLLYKQKIGEKNILSFPYFHFEKSLKHSLAETEKLCNNIKAQITKQPVVFEGFKSNNHDFYMFYSIDDNTVQHDYNETNTLYWCSMHEIVNRQKFANFNIHCSTIEFFYNNTEFIHCRDSNIIKLPIVVLCDIKKQSFLEIMQQFKENKYFLENNEKINYKNKFIRINIFDYEIINNIIYYDKINSNILSIHY